MGALFHRERTGEATTVDVSLLGTGIWSMGAAFALSMQLGMPWQPPPRGTNMGNPLVSTYQAKDGRYVSSVLPPGRQVLGRAGHPRGSARARHRRAVRRPGRHPGARHGGRRAPPRGVRRAHGGGVARGARGLLGPVDAGAVRPSRPIEDPQTIANGYIVESAHGRGHARSSWPRRRCSSAMICRAPAGRRSSTSTATRSSRASASTRSRSSTSRSAASSPRTSPSLNKETARHGSLRCLPLRRQASRGRRWRHRHGRGRRRAGEGRRRRGRGHGLRADVTLDGVKAIQLDLADKASIDAAIEECGGPIHALFSCAGVAEGTPGIEKINFIGHRYMIEPAAREGRPPARRRPSG